MVATDRDAVSLAGAGQLPGTRVRPSGIIRRRKPRRRDEGSLWMFLVPSGLLLATVMFFPLGYALYLSLCHYDLGSGANEFIGLGNYGALLADARLWASLFRTIGIVASAVGLEFVAGLLVAYGLYLLTRGVKTFNLLLFLPSVITPVVAGLFLKWMFMGRWGLIDNILMSLNFFPVDWLGSAIWARVAIVLADAWQHTPFVILVMYAGLNTVDQSQIEAAKLDGAGAWTVLFRIMLPAIKPLILFVLVIRVMDAFRMFDTVYVLTAGGPGTATETLTMYTYTLAFRLLLIGKASALGVLTLIAIAAMTAGVIAVLYRRERGAI
jgi:multiple sugar transport system permease protein